MKKKTLIIISIITILSISLVLYLSFINPQPIKMIQSLINPPIDQVLFPSSINSFRPNPELESFRVEIDNGIKISYDNYSATYQPRFIVNGQVYAWGDIPTSIEKDLWKRQVQPNKYKYGVNFNNVSTNIKNDIQYVVLHRVSSVNLTMDDIEISGNSIIVKNKLTLSHDDLLVNFTIPVINKTDVVIGNITANFIDNGDGTWNITFDPTIEIAEPNTIIDSYLVNITNQSEFTHLDISDQAPYDNLVAYWNFDNDMNEWVDGKVGDALEFDGDGDYINPGNDQSLNMTNNFTVSAWVKLADAVSGWHGIVHKSTNLDLVGSSYFLTMNTGTNARFYITDGSSWYFSTSAITKDAWHHLVGMWNGTDTSLFVDGILQDSDAAAITLQTSVKEISIGAVDSNEGFFNGSIDEVMIFNRSLTATEILDLYNNQTNGTNSLTDDADLVMYHTLNKTMEDSSANDNDGSLNGFSPTGFDLTKNDNDGTYTNNAYQKGDCLYGDCGEFDGINDYIELDNSALDSKGNSGLTLSAWVYQKGGCTGTECLIFQRHTAYTTAQGTMRIQGVGNAATIRTIINISGNAGISRDSTAKVLPNTWTHIAMTFNSTDIRFYFNGTLTDIHNDFTPGYIDGDYNANAYAIGGRTSDFFNGSLDELMIFNVSLTAEQILEIYNNQSSRFKDVGTQRVRAINISGSESNRVNLTANYDVLFGSNLTARIGQINNSANTDGLVLYMPFEWGSAVDISGEGNDGAVTGAIFNATGGVNDTGGFVFDGVNAKYINLGQPIELNITDKIDLTFSLWAYPLASGSHSLIFKADAGLNGDYGWGWWIASNNQTYWSANNGSATVENENSNTLHTVKINAWNHLVVVVNRSTNQIIFYLNGGNQDTNSITEVADGSWDKDSENVWIGLRASVSQIWNFNGTLDEVMIWNKSLSAEEISALYLNQSRKFNTIYYTPYQNLTASGQNTTFTISTEADYIFPDFKFEAGNFTNPFYSPILKGDIILDTFNISEAPAADVEYPIFSNYNYSVYNGTEYGNLVYGFNVTLLSTNGTVGLEFNGVNYSSINISSIFNTSVLDLGAGTYTYFWWAYGNGTSTNYNISALQSYTVAKNSTWETKLAIDAAPPDSWTYNFGTETTVTGSKCPTQITCALDKNDTGAVANPHTETLGGGYYNYTFNSTGNDNYTEGHKSHTLTINAIASSLNLTINWTQGNYTADNLSSEVWINSSFITGYGDLEIYLNGSVNFTGYATTTSPIQNLTNLTISNLIYNITSIFSGNENYSSSQQTWWVNMTEHYVIHPTFKTNLSIPSSPATYVNGGNYTFKIDINNSNGSIFFEFNGVNYTTYFDGGKIYNATVQDLPAGTYSYFWSAYGNDSTTPYNTSLTGSYTINRATPTLSLTGTSPITYGTASDFQGTETNIGDNCTYELFADHVAVSNPDNTVYGVGVSPVNYTYNTTGCDNYTSQQTSSLLTVNQETGVVYAYINNTRANFSASNTSATTHENIWLNGTLNTGSGDIQLMLNGTQIGFGSSPLSNLTNLSIGFYNLTSIYIGNENYTVDQETWWVNISSIPYVPPPVTHYSHIFSIVPVREDVPYVQLNRSLDFT